MYTLLIADFCIPKMSAADKISGQHSKCFHILIVFLSKHRADRFLLWWLFLHRRLRSRQRGLSCDKRLLLSSRWFLAENCFSFLSEKPEKVFQLFLEQSLSASIQGVNSNFFPSFAALKQCVTALPASPCIGQKPVSIFDL
jgi:hypothetical protein